MKVIKIGSLAFCILTIIVSTGTFFDLLSKNTIAFKSWIFASITNIGWALTVVGPILLVGLCIDKLIKISNEKARRT